MCRWRLQGGEAMSDSAVRAAGNSRPVIACNLDDDQVERLRAHPSNPIVLAYSDSRPVWDVPSEADFLFTFFKGWSVAPKEPPAGWPHRLKWVQIASAGIDAFPAWVFDAPLVTTGRGISAEAIAEYAIAAIFAHEKKLFEDLLVHSRSEWNKRTLGTVSGKGLGILGFGAIGARVAGKALALGMYVSAVTRSSGLANGEVKRYGTLEEMIADVDHLLLAVPLTEATRHIVKLDTLRKAKPGLHIINVCRGDVIDDNALLDALDEGRIAAATLDVTTPEPLPDGHAFYKHPSIRLTPHISWTSEDNPARIAAKLHANLDRFLSGDELEDIVVAGRGY